MSRRNIWTFIAVGALCASAAQAQDINGLLSNPRVFNDIPGSTLTMLHTNSNPGIASITDSFPDPAGGVNRHDILLSSDNGVTAHGFNIGDKFTFSVDVNLASPALQGREAGIRMNSGGLGQVCPGDGPPDCSGDVLYLVKDNGEIASFAGGAPFNTFSGGDQPDYVPGSTITIGFTYLGNVGEGPARIRYFVDRTPGIAGGYDQTEFGAFSNLEEGVFSGFNVAMYSQGGVGGLGAPSTYTATFNNATFTAIPEPATMMLGLIALFGTFGVARRR